MLNIKHKNICNYSVFAGIISLIVVFVVKPANVWLDEAALGVNVINKSFSELLNPLEFNQVAPIGFLFLTKTIGSFFGYSDLTLRIPSIIAMFCSLILLLKLVDSKSEVRLGHGAVFALGFWIYYGFEFKQYIFDFLSLTTFYYMIWMVSKRQLYWLSLLLILGWFSNIALTLIPFLFGVYCLVNRQLLLRNVIYLFLAGLNFFIYYFSFIYKHPYSDRMFKYWMNQFVDIYNPINWFYNFFKNFASFNVSGPNVYFRLIVFLLLIILVIFQLRHKKLSSILLDNYLLLLPFVFAILLSFFHYYPLDGGRLSLYLAVPSIIIFSKIRVGDKDFLGLFKIKSIFLFVFLFFTLVKVAFLKSFRPEQDIRQFLNLNNINNKVVFLGSTIKHYEYYRSLGLLVPSDNLFYCSQDNMASISCATCDTLTFVEAHSKLVELLPKRLFISGVDFLLLDSTYSNGCRKKIYLKNFH